MRKRSLKHFRRVDKQSEKSYYKYFTLDSAIILALIPAALYFSGFSYYWALCSRLAINATQIEIPPYTVIVYSVVAPLAVLATFTLFLMIKVAVDDVTKQSWKSLDIIDVCFILGMLASLLNVFHFKFFIGTLYNIGTIGSFSTFILLLVLAFRKWYAKEDFTKKPKYEWMKTIAIWYCVFFSFMCIYSSSYCLGNLQANTLEAGTGIKVDLLTDDQQVVSGLLILCMNNHYYILTRINDQQNLATVIIDRNRVKYAEQNFQDKWPSINSNEELKPAEEKKNDLDEPLKIEEPIDEVQRE